MYQCVLRNYSNVYQPTTLFISTKLIHYVHSSLYCLTICDFIGDEQLLLKSLRCLALLLTYSKSKKAVGDIPYLMTFVPVSIPLIYLCWPFVHFSYFNRLVHHLHKQCRQGTISLIWLSSNMMSTSSICDWICEKGSYTRIQFCDFKDV